MDEDEILRHSSCTSKLRYATQGDANKALKRLTRSGHIKRRAYDGGKIVVYRCRYCDGFHAGHDNDKQKFKILRSIEMRREIP